MRSARRLPRRRLDELAVRVFVSAIHQLPERVHAVGPLVVDAREIERTERDCATAGSTKSPAKRPVDCSSTSRTSALSNAASCSPARPRRSARPELSSCGPAPVARRRGSRITCSAPAARDLLEQRATSAPGRSHRRCVSPRQGPSAGNVHQVRLGRDRHRQGGRQRVHRVIARDAGQVERLDASCGRRRPRRAGRRTAADARSPSNAKTTSRRASMSCTIDEQLAESRLTKVVAQADRRSCVASSSAGGAARGAAPRIRFHSSATLRPTMPATSSGDPTRRHTQPCRMRRAPARARTRNRDADGQRERRHEQRRTARGAESRWAAPLARTAPATQRL